MGLALRRPRKAMGVNETIPAECSIDAARDYPVDSLEEKSPWKT